MATSLNLFIGAVLLIHIFLAVFTMQELIEHPLINKISKLFWFLIIWLTPFVGVAVFRRSYKLEKTTGKYDNNDVDGPSYDKYDE